MVKFKLICTTTMRVTEGYARGDARSDQYLRSLVLGAQETRQSSERTSPPSTETSYKTMTHLLKLQVRALVCHPLVADTELPPRRRSELRRVLGDMLRVSACCGRRLLVEQRRVEYGGLEGRDGGRGQGDGARGARGGRLGEFGGRYGVTDVARGLRERRRRRAHRRWRLKREKGVTRNKGPPGDEFI